MANLHEKKRAFLTGISGQDGSYLSEYLLELGYEVHGIIRRNSTPEHQESRIGHLGDQIKTYYGDITDQSGLERLIREIQPHEIYNLAAQSHVRISSDVPQFTVQTNANGVLNMLEAYRQGCPTAKFYQASSSEMFGNSVDPDGFQRETTPMHPVSPYGCAKLFGYHITNHYRDAHGLHCSNGILFNHESPRRGSNFVTNKVVKTAVMISIGLASKLEMGNLSSSRDWGHSWDYVRAMHMIINQPDPSNFVVATGITHSVKEMVEFVFEYLGLDWRNHVEINNKFKRPHELGYLKGDSTRIRALGWAPKVSFEEMMIEMIGHWQQHFQNYIR